MLICKNLSVDSIGITFVLINRTICEQVFEFLIEVFKRLKLNGEKREVKGEVGGLGNFGRC